MDIRTARPRLGISACLLGDAVRFDGGHKRNPFLVSLTGHVDWTPICPEVEAGMGIPRPAMRLIAFDTRIRLIEAKTGRDRTADMDAQIPSMLERLGVHRLSGFVLKKDSPTCGFDRVKVYADISGVPARAGRGIFAAALARHAPLLPIEEEGRLSDPVLRDNFLQRVFVFQRLQDLFSDRWTIGDLVRFHTAHKLLLLAHEPSAYGELGRLVANPHTMARGTLRNAYSSAFMKAFERPATPARHVNVLEHMLGYFSRVLDVDCRAELRALIARFAAGVVPLAAPVTLLAHHIRRSGIQYLSGQLYLRPYPEELRR